VTGWGLAKNMGKILLKPGRRWVAFFTAREFAGAGGTRILRLTARL
jgi:hypothetical protein